MLWSMARLRGYGLHARDGEIGQVVTVCFDEAEWMVRSLVVDTERWTASHEVLIPPHVLGDIDRDRREMQVHLSREQVRRAESAGAPGLHTAKALAGCAVIGGGERVGQVEDVLIDDDGWHLRYIIIAAGLWLPERKVPLPLEWVTQVSWAEQEVITPLTAETLRGSPDYGDETSIDFAYEERLYAHYGRP